MLPKKLFVLIVVLYVFGALVHLGRMYFHREEPRRSIIAMEMNYTKNYIQPQVLGRPYFKKPPLHNIALAIFFKVFGMNEWSARLVSVLSMFLISVVIYVILKETLGFEAALFGAFGFATALISYFNYGMLAETDMFFSLLVFASMIGIFNDRYFLGSVFAGFALLAKGFPALHYFYLTLFTYSLVKGNFKKVIFSRSVIFGGLFILVLFLIWLVLVSKGNIHRFNLALGVLLEASGRRVLSIENVQAALVHMVKFPVSFFISFLPLSGALLLLLKRDFRGNFLETIRSDMNIKDLYLFSLSAFLPNFLIYWVLPDGRTRYTLVLFAVLSLFLGIIYYVFEALEDFDFKKLFVWLAIIGSILAVFSVFFDFEFVKGRDYLLSVLCVVSLPVFYKIVKGLSTQALALLVGGVLYAVVFKLLYIATYQAYLYTYYEDYRSDGAKVAKIILSNHTKYVMTDGGNLRFFVYVERGLGFQMHPFDRKRRGIVITRDKARINTLLYKLELPDHVYYVGTYNGGV